MKGVCHLSPHFVKTRSEQMLLVGHGGYDDGHDGRRSCGLLGIGHEQLAETRGSLRRPLNSASTAFFPSAMCIATRFGSARLCTRRAASESAVPRAGGPSKILEGRCDS